MVAPSSDTVAAVREFNRFYAGVVGALGDSVNQTQFTLAEARVLYELSEGRVDVAELRRVLDIDAGYLTRILTRLAAAGLVTRQRSTTDARRQVVELTDDGRAAKDLVDERSSDAVADSLRHLAAHDQRRLVQAMGAVRGLLGGDWRGGNVVLRDAVAGELGWVVQRNAAVLAHEYGYDVSFEAQVARTVADFAVGHDPTRERVWIAEIDGARVGCVLCVRDGDETARLRFLLVEPMSRGLGVGRLLVDACVQFAEDAGYRRVVLRAYDEFDAAARLVQRAGFRNVGENWELDFRSRR